MRKYNFPDELMARFYDGETTPDETMMILNAAKEDSELRKEIGFMTTFPEELMDVRIKKQPSGPAYATSVNGPLLMAAEPSAEGQSQVAYLPMWQLAAKSRVSGHDMKALNDCVVRCEHYILQQFNINASVEALTHQSKRKGWLKEGGTPLHQIGRLLSEFHRLSVARRYDCDFNAVIQELSSGCQVIAVINADKLYGNKVERINPNHAVVVLAVNNQNVCIFNPEHALVETHLKAHFNFAWKDSDYYIVSVTRRGLRQYDPRPINASYCQLPDNLYELMEAIAENCHDIWARQRMDDGWTYGPQRDDEHKKHPDLVPYSDLTESEKEYDRKMAQGTLELVRRIGYRIERDE